MFPVIMRRPHIQEKFGSRDSVRKAGHPYARTSALIFLGFESWDVSYFLLVIRSLCGLKKWRKRMFCKKSRFLQICEKMPTLDPKCVFSCLHQNCVRWCINVFLLKLYLSIFLMIMRSTSKEIWFSSYGPKRDRVNIGY